MVRAYKFKSSSQIARALDIILYDRLYCADWSTMNDPMEGMFVCSYESTKQGDAKRAVEDTVREKKQIRICSLSETFDCHLLWAHYASGFSGLAVEVELPDGSPYVRRVEYRGVFAGVEINGTVDPQAAAEEILYSKYSEWSYEKEVRILYREEFFRLQHPVRHIIVGHRMEPALVTALQVICDRKGVRLSRTGIGDEGIDADNVPPLENWPLAARHGA